MWYLACGCLLYRFVHIHGTRGIRLQKVLRCSAVIFSISLCVRHSKKSTSPTTCQFKTQILTALVNELHLWCLQSSCRHITKCNFEVWHIKIFGSYMYVCIIIKQLLCMCCEHTLLNTSSLGYDIFYFITLRANQHKVTSSTLFTFDNMLESSLVSSFGFMPV